ncbi:MAG: translation initiation factor 2 [Sedimenticola sp.]|nr:translation initiation factor 2 [Sedimenticola sp.]
MADDPRRVLVEVVARLGRETQLHLDERHRHFWVTNVVTLVIALLLLILAAFNVYYVKVLYEDLNGIVFNMDSMHTNLRRITDDMTGIAGHVQVIDHHMDHMESINRHTGGIADHMPGISNAMSGMAHEVNRIDLDMVVVGKSMFNIQQRAGNMTGNISIMRENVRQIARPMGIMNPFMP